MGSCEVEFEYTLSRRALRQIKAEAKADALREAAEFLEGKKGIDGIPRDLWEFRQWLYARAETLTAHPTDHTPRAEQGGES